MKIELFTLCDGAYNYNGKLTIVGTIDNVKVSQLPSTIGFSIALKLLIVPEDQGAKVLSLSFKDPEQNQLPTDITINLDIKKNQEFSHLSIAINMQGVPFKLKGKHLAEVKLDDYVIGAYTFNVEEK